MYSREFIHLKSIEQKRQESQDNASNDTILGHKQNQSNLYLKSTTNQPKCTAAEKTRRSKSIGNKGSKSKRLQAKINQDSDFEVNELKAPIVYEDIHLETWHNGSNKKGNDKLKQSDQGTTNEARFDGSTGKHRNHEETNNDGSQVSQNEPRGIGKRVYVVGDSIVSGLNEKGLSKKHTVKVRSYPGDTTKDLTDDIKPVMRKNPDLVVIHFGTNDITKNGVNTKGNLQDTIDYIYKHSPQTNIVISLCTIRMDKPGLLKKIHARNIIIKDVCTRNNLKWIDNSNLDETCLGAKKLHLNRKGCSYLANNLKKFIDCN